LVGREILGGGSLQVVLVYARILRPSSGIGLFLIACVITLERTAMHCSAVQLRGCAGANMGRKHTGRRTSLSQKTASFRSIPMQKISISFNYNAWVTILQKKGDTKANRDMTDMLKSQPLLSFRI
jgi:hypothetical protein